MSPPFLGASLLGPNADGYSHPPPLHDELVALARSFFCCLHPMTTYSFLHESSVTQRVLDDTLDPTLALALCSITAMNLRLGRYYPSKTDNWIREAEHHIWDGIENPTTFRLQALILVVQYLLGTGRFQRAFMMASIAGRSAMALRLNYERPDLTPLAQEIRRRLMWTVLMMDIRFSVGLPEFEMCPYEGIYLKLPTSDDEFNSYSQWSPPSQAIRRGEEGGLLAFVVRLTTMRRDVTRLTRQLSLSEQSVPRLVDLVEDIRRSLLRVRSETPGSRLYHLGNLEKSGGSRWRTRYWTAHLSWHQCNCDLYRPFLRGYKEAARETVLRTMKPDYMSNAASLCLEHATSIIQIIADIDQRSSDSDLMEFDNAICAYHATRIVLFMSSSKAESRLVTKDDAITQASMCLGFLRRFFSTVPTAASMIAKLEKVLAKRIRDQEDQNHSGTSSDSEENEPGLTPRLSRVARASQRLGVHSLVRQARFVDDSHSCASDTGTGSPQTSGALLDDRATSLTATSTSSAAGGTSGSVGVIRSPWMRGGDTTAPQDIRDLPASGPSLDFLGQDFHHNNIDLELNSWVAEWQQGWTRGIFEYNGEYY